MMVFGFWKNTPTRLKRILTIVIFFLLAVIVTAVGTLTPLTPEEANALNSEFNQTTNFLDNMSSIRQVSLIFGNNFMICLLAFIPIVGAIFEFFVLYSTGVMIAAISYERINPLLALSTLFIFPFAWLEFLAYSIGIAESFWLTWRIIQHKSRREILNVCKLISITAIILLAAAILEIIIRTWLQPG